jgi:hypothetical protein
MQEIFLILVGGWFSLLCLLFKLHPDENVIMYINQNIHHS